MLAGAAEGVVIRHHEEAVVASAGEFARDGADDVRVDGLECGDFDDDVALMAGFVGTFDVAADDVVGVEGGDRGSALSGVVGVVVAGEAGHFEAVPADVGGDAAEEIDAGDHAAAEAEA